MALAKRESVTALCDRVAAAFGHADRLIKNCRASNALGETIDRSPDDWW
jgi:hypothetical protein